MDEHLRLAITACLHLVRFRKSTGAHEALGSGVIVEYKGSYFVCTAAHFTDHEGTAIGILTGLSQNGYAEIYELGKFSYLDVIEFEDMPDAEDLEFVLQNPDKSAKRIDVAFRPILPPKNLYQRSLSLPLAGGGLLMVPPGCKTPINVNAPYGIDCTKLCSFFGRIRPDDQGHIINFDEYLYSNLPIAFLSEHFLKLDLGGPIRDYKRFYGCSGAPIIDTSGKIVGIFTHGMELRTHYVYGFRFDKVKEWIDLMYFKGPLDGLF